MRKFILVAALVLASASAQAGASRGLALASDEPAVTEQPKTAETPKATQAPKYVERPPAVEATTDQPKVDQPKFAPEKRVERPRHHRGLTGARIVYELHRHGIYW
jgi:hypothetical protein